MHEHWSLASGVRVVASSPSSSLQINTVLYGFTLIFFPFRIVCLCVFRWLCFFFSCLHTNSAGICSELSAALWIQQFFLLPHRHHVFSHSIAHLSRYNSHSSALTTVSVFVCIFKSICLFALASQFNCLCACVCAQVLLFFITSLISARFFRLFLLLLLVCHLPYTVFFWDIIHEPGKEKNPNISYWKQWTKIMDYFALDKNDQLNKKKRGKEKRHGIRRSLRIAKRKDSYTSYMQLMQLYSMCRKQKRRRKKTNKTK